ncbi:Fur family transcriptional regulator [Clostridium sp. BJN0001]|uniref:Fur family transcriptional regulator n=1 Tax=Clostridium sp. BJN0001 TaxID=2930219 RepID=UPI001FD28A38|nr:Fur family transcriptional regulator [Clostridium sp. BJN0001]
MDTIASIFKEKKLKLTPQRLAIYTYLRGTTAHPSAETVYSNIKKTFPTISLATVYKTLKTLSKVGLIQELNAGEDSFRYDANAKNHPHIKCIKCGKVDDFDPEFSLDEINTIAEKYTDYKILSSKVYFFGICKNCR